MFASERRKAKVLNFSIAYGKTAHGLSKDWGVTMEEAQETVNKWYGDRFEVASRASQKTACLAFWLLLSMPLLTSVVRHLLNLTAWYWPCGQPSGAAFLNFERACF